MKKVNKNLHIDTVLLTVVIVLVAIGLVFVYSASMYSAKKDFDNEYYFLIKQAIGAAVGFVCMFACVFLPTELLKKAALPCFVLSLVLLGLVFVPGIGIENYGAKRWLGSGSLSVQPSEIAKFAFVLLASAFMAKKPELMKKFRGIAIVGGMGLVVCLLIILEPNMSITMCVAAVTLCMIFIGGSISK